MAKWFKIVFLNFLVFCFLFVFCEIGHKILYPEFSYYERTYVGKFENCTAIHDMDTNWVQPDSSLGWVCKQKEQLRFYNPKLYNKSYCINPQGFRSPIDLNHLDSGKPKRRILLLGDSFIFGILQEDSKTIPAIMQQKLGDDFQVFNLAIPAWGLDQMYLAYEKYVDTIQPDLVILFYIDDDISRLLEAFYWGASTKPSFKLKNTELVEREWHEGKLNYLERLLVFNSQIINRLYKYFCEQKAIPLARAFIENMAHNELTQSRQLSIVHCPRIFQLEGKNEKGHFDLIPFPEKQPVLYYNLRDYMRQLSEEQQAVLYDIEDGHLSDRGAEFVADFLIERTLHQSDR